MLDTGKFEQWQFRMQQYLQHEHYALWEVIKFGDSYEAPKNNPSQLQFMGVEAEQDDLNQKFLTSLAPEWLMHTIINEDDMEEMDIKWNMALLSMRVDKFWKKTRKKISIQGSDVAGFDKSKVKCFNYHKMGHFAREYRAPRNQERGRRDTYRQGSKAEEQTPKALMAIDGVGWDWSY
nr:hypothetical protein [Tanacetum cinerariifolium]